MNLPISVVIPTRNCLALTRRHLPSLRRCLPSVAEVVVVDSESTDGTVELLRAELQHEKLQILSNSPGLYQTWNHGLHHCTSRYAYVATAGDAIEPAGLQHLVEVAEQFRADVVLSPPRFVTEDGKHRRRKQWSVHQYLHVTGKTQPHVLPRSHVFVSAAVHGVAGFMGSSASNLYRTDAVLRSPFPTDFSHVGDTAWGLAQSLRLHMALTPRICADFVLHEPARQITWDEAHDVEKRLFGLARETLAAALAADKLPPGAGGLNGFLDDLSQLRRSSIESTARYDRLCGHLWPWILNPIGIAARLQRDHRRRKLRQLWRDALRRYEF